MIKVCKFNSYYKELIAALEAKAIEFVVEECVWRCDLCQDGAFVQRDREYISAPTVEELIQKLGY